MAENSRVTITLGRSGQVVKRAGPVLDSGYSGSQPALGSKRSVRDRLGGDVGGIQLNNKRQRGESNKLSMNGANGVDMRLGKDDLRFKLMRKNVPRRVQSVQQNGVDLRETLSRASRHSTTSLSMRQRMPEPTDSRHLVPERKDASILGRIPSMRSADALPQMDSLRDSYSPWTLDRLRQRSPDRVLRTSRNLLPQRNDEEIMKRPIIRTYDDARTVSYMSRDIVEPGRPLGPYMTKPTIAAASVKPVVPPLAPPPPPRAIVHRSSYTGDEHLTVDGFLHSLSLEKYSISFKAEEVDMTALRQMGDNDLKDLGIPMGPRKKILLALLPRSKRRECSRKSLEVFESTPTAQLLKIYAPIPLILAHSSLIFFEKQPITSYITCTAFNCRDNRENPYRLLNRSLPDRATAMAFTTKQMSLIVATFGALSFLFGVVAENKKPASGTPITGKGVVICKYPSDPTVVLGYLSVAFLAASTVAGYLSLFYPYKGKSVPQAALFRSTSFLVFFNIALGTAGLAAAFLLWPTITEQLHLIRNVHHNLETDCPTAKTGLLGGGAFLSLDASLFWLVSLMLADNAREDYFDEGESGGKGEHGHVLANDYDADGAIKFSA